MGTDENVGCHHCFPSIFHLLLIYHRQAYIDINSISYLIIQGIKIYHSSLDKYLIELSKARVFGEFEDNHTLKILIYQFYSFLKFSV